MKEEEREEIIVDELEERNEKWQVQKHILSLVSFKI